MDFDERGEIFEQQGGFQNCKSSNHGYNSGNQGRNYYQEGQYDRPRNKEQGSWQNKERYKNKRTSVYVRPGKRDQTGSGFSWPEIVDLFAKFYRDLNLQMLESKS